MSRDRPCTASGERGERMYASAMMDVPTLLSELDVENPVADVSSSATEGEGPLWLLEAAVRLETLSRLGPNWDSYGAPPLRHEAVRTAFDLLLALSDSSTPVPQIVPTVLGGIQFEWHQGGIDLEVEVLSQFRIGVFFEDFRTGEIHEEELMADLTPLVGWLRLLSERSLA